MISKQETLNISPYMALSDLIIPKNNMLCQINELVKAECLKGSNQ